MGVTDEYVGAVIGYAGRTIREIEWVTGVPICISKGELKAGTSKSVCVVQGGGDQRDTRGGRCGEAMIVQRVSDVANSHRRQQGGGGGDRQPIKEVE
ncbi:hypothetical protein VPH35_073003 [Triticum aestivum]